MGYLEKIKQLGPEFIDAMESEKNAIYPDVYDALTKAFDVQKEIAELQIDKGHPVMSFIRKFYDLGFYAGVKFILDPDDLHKETIDKIYGK